MELTHFHIESVCQAKKLMDEKPGEHFTATALSLAIGIGTSRLQKAFKQYYSVGIYEYQLQKRLRAARALLSDSRLTIKAIAKKTGFKEVSNFTIAFKKAFGMTPRKWRG